jgi:hypothetical protein
VSLSPAARHERARIAALTRSRDPDDPDLVAARRNLAADRLERHVRDAAAQLTPAQRDRLTVLLAGGDPAYAQETAT